LLNLFIRTTVIYLRSALYGWQITPGGLRQTARLMCEVRVAASTQPCGQPDVAQGAKRIAPHLTNIRTFSTCFLSFNYHILSY